VRRRDFIVWLGTSAAALPRAARGQQTEKVYRVGLIARAWPVSTMIGPDPSDRNARAFVHTLRDLGYFEGKNLVLERRSIELRYERSGEIAAELARLGVDVIVTSGNDMTSSVARVAPDVPIVMAVSSGPAEAGLVASLARPAVNITGSTVDVGPEIETKRLEMLKEAVPSASRIAFLGDKRDWERPQGQNVRAAALTLGITLIHVEHSPADYGDALALIIRDQPHALFVARNGLGYANSQLLADFGLQQRLPGAYAFRENVEAGGLLSYGADLSDLYRRAAGYVDKILKGAKPADLPMQQPTRFELIINLKTAKVLGLTMPPTLLARADEVIE
jgi:putative ABC transport system substrate-binding protein